MSVVGGWPGLLIICCLVSGFSITKWSVITVQALSIGGGGNMYRRSFFFSAWTLFMRIMRGRGSSHN